ncbi:MAG: hypothetical protein K9J16_11005 [Melioribacteraceae bacterium]|nr:hypothetical protein [Melioribacteraceae bacterium]MCF8356286.1 hypothetical protein [Melioribacteraceae bacterium]MCF8394254.1 hypothetical protein [Melioribacteraceae bacterium]MCF8419975.1 hypothetical protein [Melioribacteraceae bacterium]
MINTHTFHIPVMGIGFTIDTPLKVSHLGIDSVISLVDDILIEKLRAHFCSKNNLNYDEITDKTPDFRAERIKSYLNLINDLACKKFNELKQSAINKGAEFIEFLDLLPDNSVIKMNYYKMLDGLINENEFNKWLDENLSMGSIDVNIMTKLDKANYLKGEKLTAEFNDAHAALRGFAESELHSSLILSAGMNPRLYSYLEQFEDFYPDENGYIKKKIVIKVSDYRSALIQGKFLAKKGLWVSEYRVESGLNCGGHAFATDGFLLGPILSEFTEKRQELTETMHEIFIKSIADKNRAVPKNKLNIKVTVQGGVGTAEEHQFLIDNYNVDSVGWGTPFLLVPEVTNVDEATRLQLCKAKEEDLYLSHISPLGVRFNSLKGNSKDLDKLSSIAKGRPGSSCPKKFLISNVEFTEKSICTASRQYQKLKIDELNKEYLTPGMYREKYDKIVDKTCICVGLGTPALLVNDIGTKVEGSGVSVCPGPNMAYFSRVMSLKEISDHIYGRTNVITRTDRPNMFIKELRLYINFLKEKISEENTDSAKHKLSLLKFADNLRDGINYYYKLFSGTKKYFSNTKKQIINDLHMCDLSIYYLSLEIENSYELAQIAS